MKKTGQHPKRALLKRVLKEAEKLDLSYAASERHQKLIDWVDQMRKAVKAEFEKRP